MRDLMFLHHLDAMSHQGCQNPDCNHPLRNEVYLTALCHEGTGLYVDYTPHRSDLPCGAVLRLRCALCWAPVTQIALRERVEWTPTCQHSWALDVQYQGGCVTVMCRRCQAPQGTADVAAYAPV